MDEVHKALKRLKLQQHLYEEQLFLLGRHFSACSFHRGTGAFALALTLSDICSSPCTSKEGEVESETLTLNFAVAR